MKWMINITLSQIIAGFVILILVNSCKERIWDNPFDPNCPKEIYTPINFKAIQQNNNVILSWEQINVKITNYKIEKQVDNGKFFLLAELDKSMTGFIDTELQGGKPHKYILYAVAGTNESNQVYTTITPVLPSTVVITSHVSTFTTNAAVLGGSVVSDGGAFVTERGICYNKISSPTVNNNKIVIGSGIGNFNHKIERLDSATTYYIRAYAVNSKGITYGDEVSFTTDEPLTDVEGNTYKTVIIGDQVWMAENLKTKKYRDGSDIPNVTDGNTWGEIKTHAYCNFNNDEKNAAIYGRLYNHWAAVNSNGICPSGWHVPSTKEWDILIDFLGGEDVAGGKLKETGTDHWDEPNTGATNESGFRALPGGLRWHDPPGQFLYLRQRGFFRAIPNVGETNYIVLKYNTSKVNNYGYQNSDHGKSIRCIKD